MSIVKTGILRYLYDDARTDIEYKSSEFWQHYLKQEFSDIQTYTVTCEVSPDESRRRVDIVVKRYDQNHHTMTALLWVECKRPGGSISEVEKQALDAAKRYLEASNSLFIYAMTTVGVSFRLWLYDKGEVALGALHGAPRSGDSSQYVDADSEHASILPRCVGLIKAEIPLRAAPILPSQALSDLQPAYGAEQDSNDGRLPDARSDDCAGGSSPSAQPYQQSWKSVDKAVANAYDQGDRPVNVKVRCEEHTFHPDQYLFEDAKGQTKRTFKNDWNRIVLGGKNVWIYYGKKTAYVSDIEIK
ncbi:hypothetical protein RB601_008568 [Gaeumannomyces tritici]